MSIIDNNKKRLNMVNQIYTQGIVDKKLLNVMKEIPRHEFVPDELKDTAYENRPVSIGKGQTISQPLMVAIMTQELRLEPTDKVLEIGTGSGYQTAILASLSKFVVTIERIPELSLNAQKALKKLGMTSIKFIIGDGTLGYPQESPYNKIIVTAGAPEVPQQYLEQLAEGGILVLPVGDQVYQTLVVIRKESGKYIREFKDGCIFVPLIGEAGWKE